MSYTDKFTGRPVDTLSDLLPELNGGVCDDCRTPVSLWTPRRDGALLLPVT